MTIFASAVRTSRLRLRSKHGYVYWITVNQLDLGFENMDIKNNRHGRAPRQKLISLSQI